MKRSLVYVFMLLASLPLVAEESKREPSCGCELLSGYLGVGDALANDNFSEAKNAASLLLKSAQEDNIGAIIAGAKAIVGSGDIAAARQAFKLLTSDVVPLAEGDSHFTVMTCSKVGADWVQFKGPVKNPYLGKKMPVGDDSGCCVTSAARH